MGKPFDQRLSAKIFLMTVEEAIRLRNSCHFPNQRRIRDHNVLRLGLEMEKARFIQGTPIFFCVLPDGTQYLVNGNHTLEAIAYSGKPQWLVMIFLQVDTIDEAAEIYINFDVHKARTWEDALKATGRDLSAPMSRQTSAAAKLIMSGFKYAPENVEANSSRVSRFDVMDSYNGPAELLQAAMEKAPSLNQRVVMRAAVLSVALETVQYQEDTAIRFWGGLVQDNGLVKGDARKTLLQYLLSHPAAKHAAGYIQSRACAQAWNAWYEKKTMHALRPSIAGKIVILGTPWDGKKGPDGDAIIAKAKARKSRIDRDEPTLLSDHFDTGIRVTPDGEELVVSYREEARP